MYVKNGINDAFERHWKTVKKDNAGPHSKKQNSPQGGGSGKGHVGQQALDAADVETRPKPKAKGGKGGRKSKGKGQGGKDDSDEANDKRVRKSFFSQSCESATVLKQKFAGALQSALAIQLLVANKDELKWARSSNLSGLVNSVFRLQEFIDASKFWSQWSVDDMDMVRQNVMHVDIEEGLSHMSKANLLVDDVISQVSLLKWQIAAGPPPSQGATNKRKRGGDLKKKPACANLGRRLRRKTAQSTQMEGDTFESA